MSNINFSTNFLNHLYIKDVDFKNLTIYNTGEDSPVTDFFTYFKFLDDDNYPTNLSINGTTADYYDNTTISSVAYKIGGSPVGDNLFNYLFENTTNKTSDDDFLGVLVLSEKIFTNVSIGEISTTGHNCIVTENATLGYDLEISETIFDDLNIIKHDALTTYTVTEAEFEFGSEAEIFDIILIPIKFIFGSSDIQEIPQKINTNIYDTTSSKYMLGTNPKLTGNIKIIVDSKEDLYFDSFEADYNLMNSKYKRKKIDKNSYYPYDIRKVFGDLPSDSLYKVKEHIFNNKTEDPLSQYNMFYNAGAEYIQSKLYNEKIRFLAPLHLGNNIPDNFVIFANDNYKINTKNNNFKDFLKDSRIVKTFSLNENSNIGTYIRNFIGDGNYKQQSLEVLYKNYEISKWVGIDYKNGLITNKGEFLFDVIEKNNFSNIELDEYITNGFERNNLIYHRLLNIEYLFDDVEASNHSLTSYFGLYLADNEIQELNMNFESLRIEPNDILENNNFSVEGNYISVESETIINGVPGSAFSQLNIADTICTINGENNYKLKVNKITPEGSVFNFKFNNKSFDVSQLLNFDKNIKYYKAEPVQNTPAYAFINFGELDLSYPLELQIKLPNNDTYILYGSKNIPPGEFIDYISDDSDGTHKIAFSYLGNQDTILSTLFESINIIGIFETEKITLNEFLIKSINPGSDLNHTSITVINDNIITDVVPEIFLTTYLRGGSVLSNQFIIFDDTLNPINESTYFKTNTGFSTIKNFDGVRILKYIYNTKYKLLTLDENDTIYLENDYVLQYDLLKPQLAIQSIFPISSFDFRVDGYTENDVIYDELKLLDAERSTSLISDSLTLRKNIFYKIPDVRDDISIYFEDMVNANKQAIIDMYGGVDDALADIHLQYKATTLTSTINITAPENTFNVHIDINSPTTESYIRFNFSTVDLVGFTGIRISDNVFIPEDQLIPINTHGFTYSFELTDVTLFDLYKNLSEIYLLCTFTQPLLTNDHLSINDDYPIVINSSFIDDFYTNYILSKINIIYANTSDNPVPLELINGNGTCLYIYEHTDTEIISTIDINCCVLKLTNTYSFVNDLYQFDPSIIRVDNLTILQNNKLVGYLNNITDIKNKIDEGDTDSSLVIPTINKWVYLNSTNYNGDDYRLNNTSILSSSVNSMETSKISLSARNLNWANLDNTQTDAAHLCEINTDALYNTEIDYFAYFLNGKYSYINNENNKNITVFNGSKYVFDTITDLSNYRFAIVFKYKHFNNKYVESSTFVNTTFKTITIVIYIDYKNETFNGYGMLYTMMYSNTTKYNALHYLEQTTNILDDYYVPNVINNTDNILNIANEDGEYVIPFDENFNLDESSTLLFLQKTRVYDVLYKYYILNNTEFNENLALITKDNSNICNYMDVGVFTDTFNYNSGTFYDNYNMVLNNSIDLYDVQNKKLNINKLTSDTIPLNVVQPRTVNNTYKYDGFFTPKINDSINFDDNGIISTQNMDLGFFKNVKFGVNNYTINEFYFNKLTSSNLDVYYDSYPHPIFASSLDKEYYKTYTGNNTFTPLQFETINKNFFNSLIFKLVDEYEITPTQDELIYNIENKNQNEILNVKINLNIILYRYFKTKVNINNVNIKNFIEYNIIPKIKLHTVTVDSNILNKIDYQSSNKIININTMNQTLSNFTSTKNIDFTLNKSNILTCAIVALKKYKAEYKIKLVINTI